MMQLSELTFADGQVKEMRSSLNEFVVVFVDWQEQQWDLAFENTIGVEAFSVEGEDLDAVEEQQDNELIARSRRIAEEPDAPMTCYVFRSAWREEPLLTIVAASCLVREVL